MTQPMEHPGHWSSNYCLITLYSPLYYLSSWRVLEREHQGFIIRRTERVNIPYITIESAKHIMLFILQR